MTILNKDSAITFVLWFNFGSVFNKGGFITYFIRKATSNQFIHTKEAANYIKTFLKKGRL